MLFIFMNSLKILLLKYIKIIENYIYGFLYFYSFTNYLCSPHSQRREKGLFLQNIGILDKLIEKRWWSHTSSLKDKEYSVSRHAFGIWIEVWCKRRKIETVSNGLRILGDPYLFSGRVEAIHRLVALLKHKIAVHALWALNRFEGFINELRQRSFMQRAAANGVITAKNVLKMKAVDPKR